MRKSIKKIAASMLAATMVLGSVVSASALTIEEGVITDVEDGEVVYLYAGAATGWGDGLTQESSMFTQVDGLAEGVLSKTVTMTADGEWTKRFSICGATYNEATGDETLGTWARQLIGEPNYIPQSAYTCVSTLAIDSIEADTELTVYYDTRTATVLVTDAEGNKVDYTVYWVSNDRDENGYTLDELAAMTMDEFEAQLGDDRAGDFAGIKATTELTGSLFDGTYIANVDGLAAYVAGGEDYVVVEEETTTAAETTTAVEATTAAATTAAATTAAATTAAATTAANASTKTGDVAPVALMVTLFAAVAVVAVVAKKKEA